jgi:hypothetical protein
MLTGSSVFEGAGTPQPQISAKLHCLGVSKLCTPVSSAAAPVLRALQVQVSEAFNLRAKWNLEAHFPDLEG